MGAQFDYRTVYGDNLSNEDIIKHFEKTVEECEWSNGHGGYTGTFAEACHGLEFYSETFQNEEEALEHLRTHTGKQNPRGFLESFSSKNYTNCARFPGGAVYGGDYSY